jgi:hypothetical protein
MLEIGAEIGAGSVNYFRSSAWLKASSAIFGATTFYTFSWRIAYLFFLFSSSSSPASFLISVSAKNPFEIPDSASSFYLFSSSSYFI